MPNLKNENERKQKKIESIQFAIMSETCNFVEKEKRTRKISVRIVLIEINKKKKERNVLFFFFIFKKVCSYPVISGRRA